uniref:LAGLIDADG endonuclease n=1 Tax=Monilinia laxa TaxID=61186 RepID=A0A7L8EZL3_MONLA|nr:LAGLIDADG endonuclease [Monilinia laxa]QOE17484.1 LAGLIDADG endonuclease [Monilinia laxa]
MYCEKDPYRFNSSSLKGKPVDIILISTRWMFCFMDIYSMFYLKNVKRVPCNIYDLLTPSVLAHWVMSDGTRLQGRGIKLGADFNGTFDTIKLINVLIIKYRLCCNLQLEKDKHSIYIYRSSLNTLAINIKPFMLPCMYYKII